MMRIARDHGVLLHVVGALPWQQLVPYEAVYRVEFAEENERQRKADQAGRSK